MTPGDRGRRRARRDHGGARLRGRRRDGHAARGPRPPRRRRLLVHARRDRTPTTASTCSCAAAPPTASCSSEIGAVDGVTLQPRLEIPVLAPGGRPAWLRRSGLPAPLHLARRAAALPAPRRPRAGPACARDAGARATSIPTIRPPTRARSATGCASTARAPRRSSAIWSLIVRPTLNLRAGRRVARAGRPGVPGRAAERSPRPATSAMPACRCRRSTIARRGGRSPAPASRCACGAA